MRPSHPARPARPSVGDTLFETFVAAGSGGAVIAFFFFAKDLLAGQALATPSLAGQVMFFGVDPAQASGVDITAIANMTVLHLAAFVAVGMIASFAARAVRTVTARSFVPSVVVLFALLELPALVVSGVFFPELGAAIGQGSILAANVLAAVAMTASLRLARRSATARAEREEEAPEVAASV